MHRFLMPLAATALATSALAANFDLDTVSPDAAAIIHVDVNALRHSALGPFLEMAAAQASEEIAEEIGQDIDLLNMINALTVYVIAESLDDVDEDQLVAILDADDDLLELIDSFRDEVPDIDTRRRGGMSFEAWQVEEDTTLFMHIEEHRNNATIVIAFDDDMLVDALKILDDDDDSYRDAHGDAFDDADNAMVFVIADVSAAPELDGPASQILDFAKNVSAMITDEGDDLGVSLSITTDSTDNAQRLGKLIEGLMAFAQFASEAKDEMDDEMAFVFGLFDSIDTDIDGNRFTLSLKLPEEMIEEIMEHADF